jgi:hypothetical protein
MLPAVILSEKLVSSATLWHSGVSWTDLPPTPRVSSQQKGARQMAKVSKKEIKQKIAARLEKIAKHESKIKKLKKALK